MRFALKPIVEAIDADRHDRQKRVSGWNQDAVGEARVLVVGAGALGNEVVKNLLQLGVVKITLVDYDEIVPANLNRCVFFSEADVGKKKAEVVAREARRLEPAAEIAVMDKHVEHLPEDEFSKYNCAFGCLDNIGARLHLNAQCYGKVPLVDGGTAAFNGRVQTVRIPSACIECAISTRDYKLLWKKYSCVGEVLDFLDPKMPALPTTTGIIAAIQANEFLKLLLNQGETLENKFLFYDGLKGEAKTYGVPKRAGCPVHP